MIILSIIIPWSELRRHSSTEPLDTGGVRGGKSSISHVCLKRERVWLVFSQQESINCLVCAKQVAGHSHFCNLYVTKLTLLTISGITTTRKGLQTIVFAVLIALVLCLKCFIPMCNISKCKDIAK
jgi:hypothetical protein